MVETSLNYLAAMEEKPVYYRHEPPARASWRNTRGDGRAMRILDARALAADRIRTRIPSHSSQYSGA
jgi:hypothetical protein